MFRVYDNKENNWVNKDVLLARNDDLFRRDDALFSTSKLNLMSDKRYTWQQSIGFYDSNGKIIYEGDICEVNVNDETIYCLVAYIHERASYMLLDNKHSAAYGFYKEVTELIKVVGNVFDNNDLIRQENNNATSNDDV